MGSERRFIYGSYYSDQKSIIGTEFQQTNSSNIELNQPENVFHDAPGINHPQRDNSFNFRSDSHIDRTYRDFPSNSRNIVRGAESNRQYHGNLSGNYISTERPAHSFEFEPRQHALNSVHLGGSITQHIQSNIRDAESSRGLVGYSISNQTPAHSFDSNRQQAFNNYHNTDADRNQNDVQNTEPSRPYYGNSINSRQDPVHAFEFDPRQHVRSYNAGLEARTNNQYQRSGPSSSSEPNRHYHDFGGPVGRPYSIYSDGVGSQQAFNVNADETDNATNREHSKLMSKILRMYKTSAPSSFSIKRDKFEKSDWLRVSYVCCGGLRKYCSEMTCVLCFGKVTPQNKEKEPGVIPKWDLSSVARHLKSFHDESINGGERVLKRLQSKKSQRMNENEIEQSPDEEDEGEVAALLEENIDHSEKCDELKNSTEKDKPKKCEKAKKTGAMASLDNKKETSRIEKQPKDSLSSTGSSLSEISLTESSSESSDSACESSSGLTTAKNDTKQHQTRKRSYSKKASDDKKVTKGCKKQPIKSRKIAESSSSSSETEDVAADWRNPGVIFGWIKLSKLSKFQPAFIFPKEKGKKQQEARYIQTNGDLSNYKHPVVAIATLAETKSANKSKKSNLHLKAIELFNAKNQTKY